MALFGSKEAKERASFKWPVAVHPKSDGAYYARDYDGYSKIRVRHIHDVKSTKLDHDLMKSMTESVDLFGGITAERAQTKVLPEVADGRGGKSELTCNERWTLRFGLGEYSWSHEARQIIFNALPKMDVRDTKDFKIYGKSEIDKVLFGPTLVELQQPPEKKRRGQKDNQILVDGMLLDREMLLAAREALEDDGVIDAREAVKIFQYAADTDYVLTRCERWTFRFIISSHQFTDNALNFLKEALQKLKQDDSHEA